MRTCLFFFILILVLCGLNCSEEATTQQENKTPVISKLIMDPESVGINEICTISCDVTDPNNDNLSYSGMLLLALLAITVHILSGWHQIPLEHIRLIAKSQTVEDSQIAFLQIFQYMTIDSWSIVWIIKFIK